MSLPYVILTILKDNDSTGYDVTKKLSGTIGLFWSASHQQVYRELNKMLKMSWVNSSFFPQQGKPDKKIYSLTEMGVAELTKWVESPIKDQVMRDELSLKIYAAQKINNHNIKKQLHQDLKKRQKELLLLRKKLEQVSSIEPLDELYIKRNLYVLEADIKWIKQAILIL